MYLLWLGCYWLVWERTVMTSWVTHIERGVRVVTCSSACESCLSVQDKYMAGITGCADTHEYLSLKLTTLSTGGGKEEEDHSYRRVRHELSLIVHKCFNCLFDEEKSCYYCMQSKIYSLYIARCLWEWILLLWCKNMIQPRTVNWEKIIHMNKLN